MYNLQLTCLGCMEPIKDPIWIDMGFGYCYHTQCEHLHQYLLGPNENFPKVEGEEGE